MTKKRSQTALSADRWSYLWLLLGALLFIFGTMRWTVPFAVWLSPIFILRFIRVQKPLWGLIAALIVFIIGSTIALYGVMPGMMPLVVTIIMALIAGIFIMLPFVADRLISPRCRGLVSTLVYPLAQVTLAYCYELARGGSFGLLSYTQYGDLPLIQIVSVTGIWGIGFLITWLATVVNFIWEQEWAWFKIRKVVGVYAGILAVVLLFGGARLALFPPEEKTVRVASITTPGIKDQFMNLLKSHEIPPLKDTVSTLDTLTLQAARFGAKIVFWQEDAAIVTKDDEAAFVDHGRELARTEKIYLMLGMTVILGPPEKEHQEKKVAVNKIVLINPAGEVAWEYLKHHLVLGIETPYYVAGRGEIPTLETPYGKIAAVICYDLDFPLFINQLKSEIDILLVPSFDWKEITPEHTHMGTFRALEHGFSLIRCTGEGLSIAVDPYGRTVAALTYFNTDDHVMISDVPMKGVTTIYSRIGDLFAWLCCAGFVVIVAWALLRRKAVSTRRKAR
jgi:apolipoprotein N-acyltransferase